MTINIAFPRPVGVVLVLLGIAAFGTMALGVAQANRQTMIDERDAKAGFVARALTAGGSKSGRVNAPDTGWAIEAKSATLAAASIDALIRARITDAGGQVLSSRAEIKGADGKAGVDQRIEIQAVVQGPMDAIQAGLFRLEDEKPLVLVDTLELRSSEDSVGAGQGETPAKLVASLTLSAFWSPQPHP